MSDETTKKAEQFEGEQEGMTKLGVSCGGPSNPKPAGTKEAAEACPVCGAKHDVAEE